MSANTSEPSAASLLREQHTSHRATIEDTSDEELGSKPTASTETAGPSTNPEPAVTAAKGPRLATESLELFPELGGANKSAGNVAPVWPARANANGKADGASPANATPEVSAPPSGTASPAFPDLSGAPPKVSLPGKYTEFFLMDKAELRPRSEMKRPMADIIRDFNRKSRAQIKVVPHSEEVLRIEATGPKGEATTQSMKDFVALIGARVKLQLDINRWARPHIIGKGGATIKAIEEKTGARVHVPKDDGQTPVDEDDDEAFIQVVVEGNSQQAAHARNIIDRIMNERAGAVTVPVKGIPAEFYPFIAGTNNSLINAIEQESGVQIRVPAAQPSSATPPTLPVSNERPVFTPAEASFIQLAGDRDAVKAAREQLEQRAQELRDQLTVEPVHIQPGRHQFIIGQRGISMDEFFDETGCTIVIPNDEDDDVVKVIGFADQVAAGVEKTADLAMGMQCSNVDISRFHRQAPGGAAAHARNVTRYLQQKRELERLGKVYNVHFNTPFSDQGALPWELYARDGKSIVKAQSAIKALVDGHPPARMATGAVDPFYHQHIRKEVAPHVRQTFGVQVVVPETSEPKAPVLLVYESTSDPESFEVARSQPTQSDIGEMQKGLKGAQSHIVDLLSGMEGVSSNSIEVPTK
jgi:rRNA processing protein Krr1/Pno1